jgi:hypothetical protein
MGNDFAVKQIIQVRRQHNLETQAVIFIFVKAFDQLDIINHQQQQQ